VSRSEWIELKALRNPADLYSAQRKYGLGPGEMSTILLAKELGANPVLLDDYRARKLAKAEGLEILGTVGLLETFYLRHYLIDLRAVFQQLLAHNVYIDLRLLNRRLQAPWHDGANLPCARDQCVPVRELIAVLNLPAPLKNSNVNRDRPPGQQISNLGASLVAGPRPFLCDLHIKFL
jgi:hypothetical protein